MNVHRSILGSPVHYSSVAGEMTSFLDRAFHIADANDSMLRHKVGIAIVAVRRAGGIPTFNQLNNYISHSEMLIPTSNYWNVINGTLSGEVMKDEEGVQTMKILGKNMAWLIKLIENGKGTVSEPIREDKIFTNFIR